jgi:hypothetical protein
MSSRSRANPGLTNRARIYFVRKTKREWGREIRKLVENVLKTHGDKPGVATQARLTVMGTVTAAMLAAAG